MTVDEAFAIMEKQIAEKKAELAELERILRISREWQEATK